MFLVTSRVTNSFHKVFQLALPRTIREITIYSRYNFTKCISQIIRLENQNYSLMHGLQNGCCVNRHENNLNLVLHLHQSSWVNRCIVNEKLYFARNLFFFSKATRLNSGHKMTSKQCWKQMCCYPSFVVLFIEHRQNRFKIILKGLGTWGMVIRNGFKSAASLGLIRESVCSLMFWSQTSTSPLYWWKS